MIKVYIITTAIFFFPHLYSLIANTGRFLVYILFLLFSYNLYTCKGTVSVPYFRPSDTYIISTIPAIYAV